MGAPRHRLRVAEPKAAYARRPPLVADASVIAAALFGETGHEEALALLHGRALHAPYLLDCEIASVGLKKLKADRVSLESVSLALQAFARLPIERHGVAAESLLVVAERYRLTAYDAAYLCVAEELGAPLATLDEKLAEAAGRYLAAESQVHDPR